jgi:hypothetical protein
MGQKETAGTGKSRFMIYCPKADGIYLVEFRPANGPIARALSAQQEDGRAALLSGTHALRLGGAGRSLRNLWRTDVRVEFCKLLLL